MQLPIAPVLPVISVRPIRKRASLPAAPPPKEILDMRDIVRMTGRHRCTIHRWIALGLFPKKSLPRGRPYGWSPLDIDRWLHGDAAKRAQELAGSGKRRAAKP
jgi:predicted DNA-binding transcriptional regulator AlpA